MSSSRIEPLRPVITGEQIQKRVKELGRQISDDYRGQTVQLLAVLENAFMFLADLVRAIEVPVVCQFIKPKYSSAAGDVMEIFFSHEPDIKGQHILLVEGLVQVVSDAPFLGTCRPYDGQEFLLDRFLHAGLRFDEGKDGYLFTCHWGDPLSVMLLKTRQLG